MQRERPEYPETKRARWLAYCCGLLAVLVPLVMSGSDRSNEAPYAFAFFAILTAVFGISVETDRLHRRIDALRDDD